jgi:Xaa-Pro dipeptidase
MTQVDRFARSYPAHHEHLRTMTDALIESSPFDGIVVYAGAPHYAFQDDSTYPFRANPSYLQWIPETDHAHSLLVLRAGQTPQLICHQPKDYWHVVPSEPAGFWVDHFEIVAAGSPDDVLDALPGNAADYAIIGEISDAVAAFGFASANPEELTRPLQFSRLRKTAYEIECIRCANIDAVAGHIAAREAFREGASEFGIHLAYLRASRHTDAQLPYSNIVALNEHGATLHYDACEKTAPSMSRSFLIDAGASCNGYAADITRTWPAMDGPFADLIGMLDEAQQNLLTGIRPGRSYIDFHQEMHESIARILVEAKLVNMDPTTMVETGVTFAFFPHGLGHHLGLQVHDVAGKQVSKEGGEIPQPDGHPFLRNLRPVEEGNVLTIEPGIYFIGQLLDDLRNRPEGANVNWSAVESLMPFGGIRIEDDIVVTLDGIDNLTRVAFASLEMT